MIKKPEGTPHYHSFILVCWREQSEEAAWHFSLENPHTGQRHGFTKPTEVVAFLQTELSQSNSKNKKH